MEKGRLEAFSDGVIAILITIMVLELHVPAGHDWASLRPLAPTLASYLLSFLYLGIYWNNHHHMLQAIERVNGNVLWANLHLLFWLSLVPWGTNWVGETHFAALPVALYGVILLLSGAAYFILSRQLVALHGEDSVLGRAVCADVKGSVPCWRCGMSARRSSSRGWRVRSTCARHHVLLTRYRSARWGRWMLA